jgi:hypothetical protein
VYEDIGHRYLGPGETAKSVAAYEMAFSKSTAASRARSMGYVHIIDGNYTKAALSRLASKDYKELDGFNFGQVDDFKEQGSFQLHPSKPLLRGDEPSRRYEATP